MAVLVTRAVVHCCDSYQSYGDRVAPLLPLALESAEIHPQ